MKPAWLQESERGSPWLLRFFVRLTLRIGRPLSRLWLYPICGYFLLFSGRARRVSREYLAQVLPRRPSWVDVFRHYHCFATTIHDRVFLLSGKHECFDLQIHGGHLVESYLSQKRGCILLGSHLGSFEVLRAYGLLRRRVPLSVIMHEETTSELNRVLHGLHPEIRERIIPPGRPDTLLRVQECIERGELVGILGDRTFSGDKAVACRFLGRPTLFPEGPLLLAALLRVPILLFFGLYLGGNRYEIRFEPFAEFVDLPRTRRSEQLRPWLERYVAHLEELCRRYPFNWFNFYELPHANDSAHHVSPDPALRVGSRSGR